MPQEGVGRELAIRQWQEAACTALLFDWGQCSLVSHCPKKSNSVLPPDCNTLCTCSAHS